MAAPNSENPRPRRGDRLFAALAPYISFDDSLRLRLVSTGFRFHLKRLGRPPPPFPWLMLPEPASPTPLVNARRRFYDIPAGRPYRYYVPGEAFRRCVASSHGWLVLVPVEKSGHLMMVNPITLLKVEVPWPFGERFVDRFHAVLTTSPHDPACLLVVASDRIVAYCCPGRFAGWIGWRTLHAAGFRYNAAASDIASVGSVVYLIDDKRKLWRVDLAAREPKVVCRDMGFLLPDGERRRHHLVEVLGLVHLVISDEHHKRVALFRMDWESRMWVPADCLRSGCVLLLGRGCSAAVPSSAAGPGRVPGSALFAHQPSISIEAGAVGGAGGGLAWFWAESRLATGPDDLLVLKKTVAHRPGEFNAGDSFWFFPAIDPDETLQVNQRLRQSKMG